MAARIGSNLWEANGSHHLHQGKFGEFESQVHSHGCHLHLWVHRRVIASEHEYQVVFAGPVVILTTGADWSALREVFRRVRLAMLGLHIGARVRLLLCWYLENASMGHDGQMVEFVVASYPPERDRHLWQTRDPEWRWSRW